MCEPISKCLRGIQTQLEELNALARNARAVAHEAAGWDGRSVKDHVTRIETRASEAEELVQETVDRLARMGARIRALEVNLVQNLEELNSAIVSGVLDRANLANRIAALEARLVGPRRG